MRAEQVTADQHVFKVKAGLVAKVVYSANNRILVVHLRTGRTIKAYRYLDVPLATYEALLASDSPAKAYAELVKKPGYVCDRVMVA